MSVLFPNVPLAIAGIPAVLRNASNLNDAYETLEQADSADVDALAVGQWGVYNKDGDRVLFPDSVVGFEFSAEHRIVDYPLAPNSFESYNKVAMPYQSRVVMAKGGTLDARNAFLTGVEILRASLDLFDIVTPERTYLDANIERVTMVRSAQAGAAMTTVELLFREIRQTASIAYSIVEQPTADATQQAAQAPAPPTPPPTTAPGTVKSPSAARRVNQGAVQAKPLPFVSPRRGAFFSNGKPAIPIGDGG